MTRSIIQSAGTSQQNMSTRARRFLDKPWTEKLTSLTFHAKRIRNALLVPRVLAMPAGFRWIAWNDVIRDEVLAGSFEAPERRFVERFLKAGMTVLDIGAYFGLYTLTASVKVGPSGRVIAFEPSPSQIWRLRWNLRLNSCRNVRVERVALGSRHAKSEFFRVERGFGGLSSLREPESYGAPVTKIRVNVTSLDKYLRDTGLSSPIDFMKVDVEGGN